MSKSKSPLENLKCITHLRCWQQSPCQAFDPLIPISKHSGASDLCFFHSCLGQFSNEEWGSSSGVINHTDGRGKSVLSLPQMWLHAFLHIFQLNQKSRCIALLLVQAGSICGYSMEEQRAARLNWAIFGRIKCAEYSRKHWAKMLLKAKVVSTSCVQSKQTNELSQNIGIPTHTSFGDRTAYWAQWWL